MKRIFVLCFAAMLATQAWAAATTFEVGNLKYTVIEGTTNVSVAKGSTKPEGSLTIPSTVKNEGTTYTVTSIGANAFYGCNGLTSVTIPNSVTTIGTYAFYNCSGISSITIPYSVTRIGEIVFGNCSNLEIVNYNAQNCTLIAHDGTYSVFKNCSSLRVLNIGENVETIPAFVFYGCYGLTSITIPNSVTSIGDYAFAHCQNMTSISIPNSVISIGSGAFYCCKGLTSITLPNSVTNISYAMFTGCSNLTSVTIPESITGIGDGAFSTCTSLTSITFPHSVISFGAGWSYHSSIKTINYANYTDVTFYDDFIYADAEKTQLIRYIGSATNITIPNTVTSMAEGAFDGYPQLFIFADAEKTQLIKYVGNATKVTVPNTVTNIAEGTFAGCSQIKEITLPFVGDKLHEPTDKYQYPFGYIFGKKEYSGSMETFPAYYGGNGITYDEFYIPENLKKVTITGGSCISYGAFEGCSNLTSVALPSTITSIEPSSFYDCTGLTSITIPNTVTSIGACAFFECTSLTSVTIPKSVTDIGEKAFSKCLKMTAINVASDNANYTSVNGVMFSKQKTTLVCCPAGKTGSYSIPNTVTNIGNGAFYHCRYLTSITIPETVTNIGPSAFSCCNSLISITIPSSVKSIEKGAFSSCAGLTSMTIPNTVTSIGNSLFSSCGNLTSVTIPNTITSITSGMFSYCKSLTSITIPETVTSIGDYAFQNCTGLTSITVPDKVTSIGKYAFQNCTSLTSITIPNSVTNISDYVFQSCTGLTSVTIPNKVTSIGNYAFYNCSGLSSIVYEGTSSPSAGSNAFQNVSTTVAVCVPEGYGTSSWCGFTNLFKGHDKVTDNAVAATCTTTGLTQGSHCSKCGKVFAAQTTTAALGHNYGSPKYTWSNEYKNCKGRVVCSRNSSHEITEKVTTTSKVTTAATCENMGTTTYTAKFTKSRFSTQTKDVVNVPALGHSYGTATYTWSTNGKSCSAKVVCQHDATHIISEKGTITSQVTTDATCETKGTTTYTANFTNQEFFATQSKDVTDIAALGHNYGTPTYTWSSDGKSCSAKAVCSRNAKHIETENAAISSNVTVAATCVEDGITTYTATFQKTLFATQTKDIVDIPATGHKAAATVAENYTAPTCVMAGSVDSVVYCSVCENKLSEKPFEIPATGHTAGEAVAENNVAPTCTAVGSVDSVVYCTVCESELNRKPIEIAATGHTEVTDASLAATCTETGLTEGKHCSVCNAELVAQEDIAATGHKEVVDAAVAATCTATGKTEGKHCEVCNAVLVAQAEIPALGHDFKTYTFDNNATTEADGTETALCEHGCGTTDTRTAAGTKIATTPEKGTAVAETAANAISIYTSNNVIVVENATAEICVYDAMGRLICRDAINRVRSEIHVNTPGVYIVRVGNVAKRVMTNY